MGYVVTFYDFRPIVRYDAQPWTHVEIYEGSVETGPWLLIEQKILTPVDSDPANPQARSFTTAAATQSDGLWYELRWKDAAENVSLSQPIFNSPNELVPDPQDVALLLRSRLRDDEGNLVAEFSADTSPTLVEVRGFIQRAVTDVQSRVAVVIPTDQVDRARNMATLYAAAQAERSYFPELTTDQRDTFQSLMTDYNNGMDNPDSGLIHECRHPYDITLH